MKGELKLEGLLENFDAIHSGDFSFDDYEIETTHYESIFVDLRVSISIPFGHPLISSEVDVDCYQEYYALDESGEEVECFLDEAQMRAIIDEVTIAIKDKLR